MTVNRRYKINVLIFFNEEDIQVLMQRGWKGEEEVYGSDFQKIFIRDEFYPEVEGSILFKSDGWKHHTQK